MAAEWGEEFLALETTWGRSSEAGFMGDFAAKLVRQQEVVQTVDNAWNADCLVPDWEIENRWVVRYDENLLRYLY